MLLEEILPYIRNGHEPTFNGEEFSSSIRDKLFLLSSGDEMLLSDKWGYVPKYVDWKEACAALVNGKEIIADWEGSYGEVVRKVFALNRGCTGRLYSRDKKRREWEYRGDGVPIQWLTSTNFEILED